MTRPLAMLMAVVFIAASTSLSACDSGHAATASDCEAIVDRIVDIELAEQGYRDEVLAARKQHELRALLHGEMSGCIGHTITDDAVACLDRARTTEEVSHTCLEH